MNSGRLKSIKPYKNTYTKFTPHMLSRNNTIPCFTEPPQTVRGLPCPEGHPAPLDASTDTYHEHGPSDHYANILIYGEDDLYRNRQDDQTTRLGRGYYGSPVPYGASHQVRRTFLQFDSLPDTVLRGYGAGSRKPFLPNFRVQIHHDSLY